MGQTEIEVGRGVTEWTDRGRRETRSQLGFCHILFLFRDFQGAEEKAPALRLYSCSCVNGIGRSPPNS